MAFLTPEYLWILVLAPLLPMLYVYILGRRKRSAVRFTNVALVKEALGSKTAYRRHVPPAVLFLALIAMMAAMARPSAYLVLPSERTTIILAMDVSGSMRARDVAPSRMTAAKTAAKDFVDEQPRNARVGLVAFSTSAMVMQDPTLVHADIMTAIDGLYPQRFTAVGSGIVASLQAIFPDFVFDPGREFRLEAAPLGEAKTEDRPAFQPVPPGSNPSAIIILLTDGRTNVGVEPLEAARMAADRGVRVYTIGFGTVNGGDVDFGGGFMRTQLDEDTLKAIAEMTKAKYFLATSEEDLKEIYGSMSAQFVSERARTEITGLFGGLAFVLLLMAGGLSLLWSNRLA
ncbi:MAG: VWA domain-containing protein [Rhodobacteraceae bacterium]|nr:VWA domain-containing protein [Paracoccaceae bacterium]